MALILRKAWEGYTFLFDDLTDPRTKSWLLIAKPFQVITLLGLYLMFVLKWGPQWMKHRKPFNLDKLLIVYNIIQILLCYYLFHQALAEAWAFKYKWICEPVDSSNTPHALAMANLVDLYFKVKVLDLLDTVFFVLRKKNNQISFLHIYHHTGMVLLIWGAVTYLPGGHGTLVGVINSFVHILMYGYYLLTVAKPSIRQSIWFKKFITQVQIVQFLWNVVHMGSLVFKTDCEYPRWTAAIFLPQNLFMLILFTNFYIKTYIRKPQQKSSVKNGKLNNNNYTNGIDKNKVKENGINKFYGEINKLNDLNNNHLNADQLEKYIVNGLSISNINFNLKNGNSKLPYSNGKSKTNGINNKQE